MGDGPALLTLKLVLIFLPALIFMLLNAFLIAQDKLSEADTEREAEDGNKKAKKMLKIMQNEAGEIDRLEALKTLFGYITVGVSVLVFDQDLRLFVFSFLDPKTPLFVLQMLNLLCTLVITLFAGLFIYLFGEVCARLIALKKPNGTAYSLLGLARVLCASVNPAYKLLNGIWQLLSKRAGTNPDYDEEVTEEEILQLVADGEESGVIDDAQKELITNVFEFDETTVSDVFQHRTDIVAVEVSQKIDDVLKIAIDEGFSRIPVYEEDLDNVIGIVYVKDLLKYVGKKVPERVSVRSIMREPYHIPQTKLCSELFEEFCEKRIQMAIAVDEYGGTAGLVTLEDLVEEIMGNIQDEYDDEDEEINKVSETTFEIEGSCDIEQVGEMLDISFPDEDFDTLGGFMLFSLGFIPKDDEQVTVDFKGYRFTATQVRERRIEKVRAQKLPEEVEQQ